MVEQWPLKTVETNTALCPQIPSRKLPVWTVWTNLNPRFKTNHSKTSISLVPRIFGVLFRLICWESQAFLPIKRKSLWSVPELDCVITGLGQSYPILNSAISHWSLSLRTRQALILGSCGQIRQCKHRIVLPMTWKCMDAAWAPVPCCLADHPDFLLYINLAENTAAPWLKFFVFGELKLNNWGLLVAWENRREKIASMMQGLLTLQNHRCKNQPSHFATISVSLTYSMFLSSI